jgi:hypothetical protein
MDPGTPARCLPQWRSHLHHDFVLNIDQAHVHTIADALQEIVKSRQLEKELVVLPLPRMMHQTSSPQLVLPKCI